MLCAAYLGEDLSLSDPRELLLFWEPALLLLWLLLWLEDLASGADDLEGCDLCTEACCLEAEGCDFCTEACCLEAEGCDFFTEACCLEAEGCDLCTEACCLEAEGCDFCTVACCLEAEGCDFCTEACCLEASDLCAVADPEEADLWVEAVDDLWVAEAADLLVASADDLWTASADELRFPSADDLWAELALCTDDCLRVSALRLACVLAYISSPSLLCSGCE